MDIVLQIEGNYLALISKGLRPAGLVLVQEWVYREDAGLLREYAAKLRKKRVKEKKGDME